MNSPGYHNACVVGIGLVGATFLATIVVRIISAMQVLKVIERATISFLPRASVPARDLSQLIEKHVIEFTIIMQQAPPPRVLPVHALWGHLEAIALDIHRVLQLEILGRSSCRVFINVSSTCIAKYVALLRESSSRRTSTHPSQPLLLSDTVTAEQVLLNESDWASVVQNSPESIVSIPLTHVGEIRNLVVVLSTESHTEITVANTESLTVSFQLAVMHDGGLIEIRNIYTQSDECLICYEHAPSTVLLPCRHCSICYRCLEQLRESKCIVCRHPFNQYIRTDNSSS